MERPVRLPISQHIVTSLIDVTYGIVICLAVSLLLYFKACVTPSACTTYLAALYLSSLIVNVVVVFLEVYCHAKRGNRSPFYCAFPFLLRHNDPHVAPI